MTLVADLQSALDPERVLADPLRLHIYGKDSGMRRGDPTVVVLAETTGEVVDVMRIAASHDIPVVPRGAGTGLASGAIAIGPAIMVAVTKMNRILKVDPIGATAWVEPGVVNLDLSKETQSLGLHFAPDPSSQSVSTIGGNVSTGAGGPHCLADGTTIGHVLAVEMVTADGEVITIGSEAPDPIGLDLRAVVVGSEGTLGIVTKVLVKLTRNPQETRTVLAAFERIEQAALAVSAVIGSGIVPAALEMIDHEMTVALENFLHAGLPVQAGGLLLVDVSGHAASVDAELVAVEEILIAEGAFDVATASDEQHRAELWKGRKSAFGAVSQIAPDYYLQDTSVPRTKLPDVVRQIYEIAHRRNLVMMNVFHAGDGNLHPIIAFDAAEPGVLDRVRQASKEILAVCVEAGGTLSGEHGIGLEKRDLMPLIFNDVDLDAQACIKEAFDPDERCNPGKVLPPGSRKTDRQVGKR
ncbi:putative FAD-linked oxidoreductase [bacterium BMS3Abin02]|nr:putative FAD-linked oxidoreductase [bacterium BMS3Abin02]GBE23026.1 putative FAD-linked oxidoreductase [bacterium BMS3Bbin01]HDL49669.1 FAD-binding protein [Actinomycetota bacterium]